MQRGKNPLNRRLGACPLPPPSSLATPLIGIDWGAENTGHESMTSQADLRCSICNDCGQVVHTLNAPITHRTL